MQLFASNLAITGHENLLHGFHCCEPPAQGRHVSRRGWSGAGHWGAFGKVKWRSGTRPAKAAYEAERSSPAAAQTIGKSNRLSGGPLHYSLLPEPPLPCIKNWRQPCIDIVKTNHCNHLVLFTTKAYGRGTFLMGCRKNSTDFPSGNVGHDVVHSS